MSKKKKILGTLGAIVCVGALATTTYFAVPEITNKSWSEMLNIGITKPTPENPTKEEYSLKISAENITYICTDNAGKTYTEEELHSKKWNGEELTFNISVNKNYYISSVKVNGETVELTENELTIEGVPAGAIYEFKVTCNKNITIEIETKEIKTYTVDIVEDRYITWQLTKNGEPLSTGDTIQTNDVLGGRVISITSGYKIGSFLINDQEKVSLLDELGRFEYNVENFDSDTLRIAGTTVRDVSSRFVNMTKDYSSFYVKNVEFVYTSEDYSVYSISGYGYYVGQEVKCTFNFQEGDTIDFVKINDQDLEYKVENQEVIFTFVVPNEDFTLSIQTEYMLPVEVVVNYDREIFNLISYNGNIEDNILSIDRTFPVELSLSFNNAENYVDENGDLLNYKIEISYADIVLECTSINEMEYILIDPTIYEVKELNISLVEIENVSRTITFVYDNTLMDVLINGEKIEQPTVVIDNSVKGFTLKPKEGFYEIVELDEYTNFIGYRILFVYDGLPHHEIYNTDAMTLLNHEIDDCNTIEIQLLERQGG